MTGRLQEMVAAYGAGAYRDSEAVQNLAEVMRHLAGKQAIAEHLYEKCLHCHLMVEPNGAKGSPDDGIAEYIHLHRGDDVDEKLDESHEAEPSGRKANLLTWKTYGPLAMRERFTS